MLNLSEKHHHLAATRYQISNSFWGRPEEHLKLRKKYQDFKFPMNEKGAMAEVYMDAIQYCIHREGYNIIDLRTCIGGLEIMRDANLNLYFWLKYGVKSPRYFKTALSAINEYIALDILLIIDSGNMELLCY
jgi:hypothetical protein